MSTEKSYSQLKAELDSVIARMQADTTDIDEALKAYETGEKLIKELETYLKNAENTLKKTKK